MPDAQSDAKVASSGRRIARVLTMAVLAFAVAFAGSAALAPEPAAAAGQAGAVTRVAQSLLGTPYRYGATGMSRFDCSGFVYRVYQMSGLLDRIGGKRRTAAGYYSWFRSRGLVTNKPAVGDLVVWGSASHIGIYVGNGMAISALVTGVARHRVNGINLRVRAYLRVNLAGQPASKTAASKASSKATQATGSTYRVRKGDTLSRIAARHGVTLKRLVQANPQIRNKNFIRVGQAIRIG